eukprot:scaffold16769_cov53-Phaeocystis_antarctica.AAC.3
MSYGSLDGAGFDHTLGRGAPVSPSASTALAGPPPPLSTKGSFPLTLPCDGADSALALRILPGIPRAGTLTFGGDPCLSVSDSAL